MHSKKLGEEMQLFWTKQNLKKAIFWKRRILIVNITWASISSYPSSKALITTLWLNVTMLMDHIRHLLSAPSLLYMFPSPGRSQVWIDQHFCHLLNLTGLQPSFTLVIYSVMAQNELALEGWSKKWQGGLGKLDPCFKLMSKDRPVNILSSTSLYLMVLGQKREVLVGTWRYWVSFRWYWLVLEVQCT